MALLAGRLLVWLVKKPVCYIPTDLTLVIVSRNHESQLIINLPNRPQQYNKRQTRVEEIEKCLVKI